MDGTTTREPCGASAQMESMSQVAVYTNMTTFDINTHIAQMHCDVWHAYLDSYMDTHMHIDPHICSAQLALISSLPSKYLQSIPHQISQRFSVHTNMRKNKVFICSN